MNSNYYLLFYETVENYLDRRAPFRPEHLELVRQAHAAGSLVMAGALANPPDGAVLVFTGENPEVAEQFARNDPYVRNGLITRWYIRDWIVVTGAMQPK
jgi:hypothetical protein